MRLINSARMRVISRPAPQHARRTSKSSSLAEQRPNSTPRKLVLIASLYLGSQGSPRKLGGEEPATRATANRNEGSFLMT